MEPTVKCELRIVLECVRCFKKIVKDWEFNEHNLTTGNWSECTATITKGIKGNVLEAAKRRGWIEGPNGNPICGVCAAKEKDQP